MNTFVLELRKEKRTGVIPVFLAVGMLGAAYAFVNFFVRKEQLLSLPLSPMDILLTQLYGMIMILNLFGIVVAACMIYNMEFQGGAIKKMYMLPVRMSKIYLCKFLILTVLLHRVIPRPFNAKYSHVASNPFRRTVRLFDRPPWQIARPAAPRSSSA